MTSATESELLAIGPGAGPSGRLIAIGGGSVYRSMDDGAHWTLVGAFVPNALPSFAVSPWDVLFAGLTYTGNGKVHRSGDGGSQWTSIPLPGATQSFSTECFAFGDDGEVYAGTIDGFYRSTDHGLQWQETSTGLLGQHIRTLAVAPNQKVYVQTLFPAQLDGFYRSSDRRLSWTRLGPGGVGDLRLSRRLVVVR